MNDLTKSIKNYLKNNEVPKSENVFDNYTVSDVIKEYINEINEQNSKNVRETMKRLFYFEMYGGSTTQINSINYNTSNYDNGKVIDGEVEEIVNTRKLLK